MCNDIYDNPQTDADEESPEKGGTSYLNEMTQDVIEWDESKILDGAFQSPQPPSSGPTETKHGIETGCVNSITKRNAEIGNEPYTPSSKSSNNSTMCAGLKRQLGSYCHSDSKGHAVAKKRNQGVDGVPNQHDDFVDLFEAIKTPNSSFGSGRLSREPLSPFDQNQLPMLKTTENRARRKDIVSYTSKNSASKEMQRPLLPVTKPTTTTEIMDSVPQPLSDKIPENDSTEETIMSKPHQSSVKVEIKMSSQKLDDDADDRSSKHQTCDEDEFGEIELSDRDLAKIDLLTHPISSRQIKKSHFSELPKLGKSDDGNVQKHSMNPGRSFASKDDGDCNNGDKRKKGTSFINDNSDEFGDFPSGFDFAEIDAIVFSQSCTSNAEQSVRQTKPAPLERKPKILETPVSMDKTKSLLKKTISKELIAEREDEDEFGSLLNDVDFSMIDTLVATQRCHSGSADTKISGEHFNPVGHSNGANYGTLCSEKKSPIMKTTDEFDAFTGDIDFESLDRAVELRMTAGANATINPCAPIRNQRAKQRSCEDLSFMKFSRYMVLKVDVDERISTKILNVATWMSSMVEMDEPINKILRDGRIKKCEYDSQGQATDSIFSGCKNIKYPPDGLLYLSGEWFDTLVNPGDVIHICSLTGQFRTDATALPIVLHSNPPLGSDNDDLILVLHPDMLMSPSIISEASCCNRRATLKSKLGSTSISSKSAFVGTMRHGLFEACMKTPEFDLLFAKRVIKDLILEKAEMMIGCNISESEAELETLSVLPMIRKFVNEYTTLRNDVPMLSSLGKPVEGVGYHQDISLLVKGIHSVEENIASPSLGLKGSIDTVLESESTEISRKHGRTVGTSCNSNDPTSRQSLMCLELKTGHNQNIQNVHMAQLSLYTLMLQNRYGAHAEPSSTLKRSSLSLQKSVEKGGAPGGILLYLNEKSEQIYHVSPRMNEVKTLMSQRNVVASDLKHALRPRGIILSSEGAEGSNDDEYITAKLLPAATANLPELKTNSHSCERCFSNRECMLYAASDPTNNFESHHKLLSQFTAHLKDEDMAYFRKWDRLIDIEAQSSSKKALKSWHTDSRIQGTENEETTEMIFDTLSSSKVGSSYALVCFRTKNASKLETSSQSFNITNGSHVIVSTNGTVRTHHAGRINTGSQLQNSLHVSKGFIESIEDDKLFISMNSVELDQIKLLNDRHQDYAQLTVKDNVESNPLLFHVHKSAHSVGTGTLRWNLINFFTGDRMTRNQDDRTAYDRRKEQRLAWLRDVVVRLKAPEFAKDQRFDLFDGIDHRIPGCNLLELYEEFDQLNDGQQIAVRKVMSGRDYTLIQGLPGTGKTATLCFLARLLVAQGRRVLITAYTHSAVDNIMLKLSDKGMGSRDSKMELSALVRIGNKRSCHASVKSILHSELAQELDEKLGNQESNGDRACPSLTSLQKVVANSRIVGVSALSLPRSPLLQSEIFDVVIIDEAGQMNEPTALGALAVADSFVLVGDDKQLPPLVHSSIAEKGGYGTSLLNRLANQHPHAIAQLTMQYRMNEEICKISSESMYGGKLRCGDKRVGSQILNLPGFPSLLPTAFNERHIPWLRSTVDPAQPVVFVDTDKITQKSGTNQSSSYNEQDYVTLEGKIGGSIVNKTEAKLVRQIIHGMEACGHNLSEIGVISPFRAQIRLIEDNVAIASWKEKGLELSTVDKYQGRDKSTIILSLVRSNKKKNAGRLLQDARRLNVAFTRAKYKLIVIGSYQTLRNGSAPLKPILDRMDLRKQRFELCNNDVG